MGNVLEIIEDGKVIAETSFEITDIKSCIWYDLLDKEQKQEEGHTKTAFYGENLKLQIETEGIDDGTELEIEIIAKNDEGTVVELKDDDDQPIKILTKVTSNKAIFEPFYVNPKWFDKDAPITFFFNLKIKDEDNYIGENLPTEIENQLKPISFGKPDEFKIDKAKGYLLEKQTDGTKIGYTSGDRLDILKYQEWFENNSEELDIKNKKQYKSYFKSVYLTYLWGWSITGEFGNEANRKSIIAEFEKAGKKYNIPPSILWTYAAGEGLLLICSKGSSTDLTEKVHSFQAFGLDFFENQAKVMRTKGYLDTSFNENSGKVIKNKSTGVETFPTPFTSEYAAIRYDDGTQLRRYEAADSATGTPINPVYFKDLLNGIKGACAVYANAFDYAATSAQNIGWGKLTLNQQVFFAYLKIQKTSEKGNAEINRYRKKSDANFLDEEYTRTKLDGGGIPNKSYHRWVVWRYVLLGKHFSK